MSLLIILDLRAFFATPLNAFSFCSFHICRNCGFSRNSRILNACEIAVYCNLKLLLIPELRFICLRSLAFNFSWLCDILLYCWRCCFSFPVFSFIFWYDENFDLISFLCNLRGRCPGGFKSWNLYYFLCEEEITHHRIPHRCDIKKAFGILYINLFIPFSLVATLIYAVSDSIIWLTITEDSYARF